MTRSKFDPRAIVAGVTLGMIVALAAFVLFINLSKPADLSARVTTLTKEVDRVERLTKRRGDPYAYAPGTLCTSAASGAAELKQRLQGAAATAGVTLTGLAVDPVEAGAVNTRVAPVTLQAAASGKYEGVVAMLSALANGQPQIFVDSVDIKPGAAGAASIKFSGKILCWTSAPR